jgi:hypothetical protein
VATAGVGLLVGSALFANASNDNDAQATALNLSLGPTGCPGPSACADLQSTRDAERRDRTWSLVLGGAGAAALVTGAVLFLLPSHDDGAKSSRIHLTPLVSTGAGGLVLHGEL